MCTVSWLAENGGYTVFFNRDERRTRRHALPPAVRDADGVRFLAATDPDGGGTWLIVNVFGVTLGLLNGYHEQDPPEPSAGYTSRGLLATALAGARDGAQLAARVRELPLAQYRAFVLPVWTPAGAGPLVRWSASGLQVQSIPQEGPLTSSSYAAERVVRSRRELFAAVARDRDDGSAAERHFDFHRSHLPNRGPFSPCMHRPDAHTVSFSRIQVDRDRVRYDYAPGAPCRTAIETSITLPRRR